MKAHILKETGGVDRLERTEVEKPRIKKDEVLIECKSLGINPVDFKVRGNEQVLNAIYGETRPAILGWDVAGIVIEKGEDVPSLNIGDRVFGMVNFPGEGNAYAEYVAAPESHLAKIPNEISFKEAAASTLAALTALQVVQNRVNRNDRVLIHAGSGGVGHFAIQIAKAKGAHVISTSSAKNKDFVLSLGADEHIDYRTQAFEDILTDIDFVFDMFNGQVLLNSLKVVKNGGTVVSIPSPEFSDEAINLAEEKDVDLVFHMVQSNSMDMNTLADLLNEGLVKPHISSEFSFDEIAAAHLQLESGRTIGKVIVNL
ncbi:MAG: NADP-dependent oxidoreductase [Bacteroidota bacterium]